MRYEYNAKRGHAKSQPPFLLYDYALAECVDQFGKT